MAKNTGGANKRQDNFLTEHVEKIGLAITILVGGLFVWSGISIEKLSSDKSPDQLKAKSVKVANYVSKPAWDGEEGLSSQRSAPEDYPERVEKLQKPILSDSYATVVPFDPPTVGQTTHRSDPNLYAAIDLRAVAITGGLAYKKSDDLDDPTVDDLPAVIKKKAPPKKKKKNDDYGFGGDAGGGPPGMEDMFGGEGDGGMEGMMGGGTDAGNVRRLAADKLIGFRPGTNKILESGTVVEIRGGASASGAEGMGAMVGGGDGAGGDMMGMMEAGGAEGGGGDMMGGGGVASTTATSVPATIVSVVGVVPFKKQWDEYSRVLQGASGYESSRDQPRYVYLYGERVDVTDNPDRAINEDEWVAVTQFKQYRDETLKWEGSPRELVDEKYLDPFITYVCPPIMMRDITGMLTHPEIPLRNAPAVADAVLEEKEEEENPEDAQDAPGGFVGEPKAGARGAGGAGGAGGGGGGMMPGGGGGMMAGGGGMMPGGGGGMMPGGGMMGGGMAGRSIPDYKMVRFFDFTAEPGRVYRYRVRLLLEDPNHPNINVTKDYPQRVAPPLRSLDQDVVARINQLDDPEHKRFFRETEWSDPTAPVSIPDPTQVFAGTAIYQPPARDQQQRAYMDKEPLGMLKPVVWDTIRGIDIPHDYTVFRGSVLNQTTDVEYAHPVSTVINAVEGFDFTTNLIVGDIRGGEELPGSNKDWRVLTPGEFALIDSQGRLIIRNELDDLDMFNRFDFKPPEQEESGSSMEDMMGGGEGGMAEMMEQGAGGGRRGN